jgi:hypothetical protein
MFIPDPRSGCLAKKIGDPDPNPDTPIKLQNFFIRIQKEKTLIWADQYPEHWQQA